MVRGLLSECESEYSETMRNETGRDEFATKLTILEDEHLTTEEGGECGGVILYNNTKRIVCINTLQSRLDLCFEELLPQIRALLFPVK